MPYKTFNTLSSRQALRRIRQEKSCSSIHSCNVTRKPSFPPDTREISDDEFLNQKNTEIPMSVTAKSLTTPSLVTESFTNVFRLPEKCDIHTSFNNQGKLYEFTNNLCVWAEQYNIAHIAVSDLLKILSKVDFSLTEICTVARTLLKTPKNARNQILNGNGGECIHFGLEAGLKRSVRENYVIYPNSVKINLNVDGLPLAKSSASQFWPILASLVDDMYTEPFPIGIFHGFNKPFDSNEFLQCFVEEASDLLEKGINVDGKNISVHLNAIICDAPAKAFITCVKGHGGYFGCSKCIQEGEFIDNRVVYLELNSCLRTDESFRDRSHPEHHKGISVLEKLGIGMVTQIPLDYMHLVCLGVVKRLIQFWVKGAVNVRLKPSQLSNINNVLMNIKLSIPLEFCRKPRRLEDIDRWKATELRQFLLYTSLVVLKNELPLNFYKHFASLAVSIRILVDPKLYIDLNHYAQSLLHWFVKTYPTLYGEKFVSYNVHNLLHLAGGVQKFGPLDKFSAFKYENYMQKIKSKIKSSGKPLQQFYNRHSEWTSRSIEPSEKNTTANLITVSKKQVKLKFHTFTLSSKSPDCMFQTKNGIFYKIISASRSENGITIKAKILSHLLSFFHEPCDSADLGIYLLQSDTDSENLVECVVPVSAVLKKYCQISSSEGDVIFPLIHSDIENTA